MLVSEIIGDARRIFGRCPDAELYPKISRAYSELANMGTWDWSTMRQYVTLDIDVLTADGGEFTLPAFIGFPLAINLDCFPSYGRSKWFLHHINGPGSRSAIDCSRGFWDDVGQVCTIRKILVPTAVKAHNESVDDAALELRIYGLDADSHEVYDADGKPGITLAMGATSTVVFSEITAVYRPQGVGVITLRQASDDVLLGYYYPDEVNPTYRRVRIPKRCRNITITYKGALQPIRALEDFIPVNNLNAMICAMLYIYYIDQRDFGNAEASRANCKRSMNDQQNQQSLQTPVGPQILDISRQASSCGLWGQDGGYGAGGWYNGGMGGG